MQPDPSMLEGFVGLMRQVRRAAPGLRSGAGPGGVNVDRELRHIEAIYNAMTPEERSRPDLLDAGRRLRIARGAGVAVTEVSRFVRQFELYRDMVRGASRRTGRRRLPDVVLGLVTHRVDRRDSSAVYPMNAPGWTPELVLLAACGAVAFLAWGIWFFMR